MPRPRSTQPPRLFLGHRSHFAVLGLICHHTLRLLGNRDVRAASSAAMTFYSAGSAGLVGEVLG